MSEIQFQKTFYGIAASLVEGDKVTSGIGRTYSEAEEALREKLSEPSSESEAAPAPEPFPRPEALKRVAEAFCIDEQTLSIYLAREEWEQTQSDAQYVYAVATTEHVLELEAALQGLLARHGDCSDERYWAEWDVARTALQSKG